MFSWTITFQSGKIAWVWGGYLDQILPNLMVQYPDEVIIKAEREHNAHTK